MTITISGFKTKEQILDWLQEYQGGVEQYFEADCSSTDMSSYIPEMKEFVELADKTNFNLVLKNYAEV